MTHTNTDNPEYAISVQNVSKKFVIPHERINTLKGAFVNIFRKKSFESFYALDNISFNVKKGEFLGIVGRNGSGKSTLLKILAGVYAPDAGSIRLQGMISPFLELGIGFNPELSGRDNIYLNATVLGLSKKLIDEKFDSIVEFSEIGRFIDQKLKNYSSGMQVRLAFSVAIHANRDILLMDEVLAVGDANFQLKCLRELNRYKAMGKTVILVSHAAAVIERYCDRAILLRNGKIEKIGTAAEISNEYTYQNMSDEERRAATQEENEQANPTDGTDSAPVLKENNIQKAAEISNMSFLDKDGNEKTVFTTGETVAIKIDFQVNKSGVPVNMGVGMHSAAGGVVFGYNTQIDGFKIAPGARSLVLRFDQLPLLKGEYFFNLTLYGDFVEDLYDFKGRYKILKMYSTDQEGQYGGMVSIKHSWEAGPR